MSKFLLDETVLELEDFLKSNVQFRKVGDVDYPAKRATNSTVVKFAKENNLVLVTRDEKMVNQCRDEGVEYITLNDLDFAKKIIHHSIVDSFD